MTHKIEEREGITLALMNCIQNDTGHNTDRL